MRRSHRRLAILVLCLAVVGLGAWWTHRRFEAQLEDGRAQTLARLLATSHTPRLVEAPGVEAWLLDLLHDVGIPEALLRPSHEPPARMDPVTALLHGQVPTKSSAAVTVVDSPGDPGHEGSFRLTKHVQLGHDTLVLDRRRNLFESRPDLGPDLRRASAHLVAAAASWNERRHDDEPHLLRLYVVMEDGSFLSRPFPGPTPSGGDPLEQETRLSQRRPGEPNLVSSAVFREFDFERPLAEQTHYSGIYADVGGSGFVATISVPVQYPGSRNRLMLAADVVADVDLARLERADGPQLRIVTEPVASTPSPRAPWWQPWSTLAKSLRPDAPEALRREVQVQALREGRENAWAPQGPVVHHRLEDGRGALFAVQVSRERWLVGWTMQGRASMPWGSMLVIPGLLVVLLLWAERRWFRAEEERDAAQDAIDRLDVPLVVVDPNDDTVVRANAAACSVGLRPGQPFADSVEPDADARALYRQEQAGGGRRRAYGVRLRGDDGTSSFALVRSVSLREPLPGFGAAAHHRLGLVCVVEDEAELAPVLDVHRDTARRDERNRLAALLDHGADTLARVLASQLEHARTEDEQAFCRWLAEYLLRRLQVSQWVLGHWGGRARPEAERILGPEHLAGALGQYERIFAVVRGDPRLRARLHWNNGALASAGEVGERSAVLESWVDWPEGYRLTVPADGVFGFLLGELLVNAIKHGAPGTTVALEAEVDRGRRELGLHVHNTVVEVSKPTRADKAYGGRSIAEELARLCGWELHLEREGDTFHARLRCPLTQRRDPGEVD
ncbi:MAG: hypothetical protein ACRBN8_02035 [Nannocystales bacterium]